MTNKVRAAHDALEALLDTAFADAARHRNPSGDKPPAAKSNGLAAYVALQDDTSPEVTGVMTGPIYELQAAAMVVLALSGKSKNERQAEAYVLLGVLTQALAADPTLGGAVEYADIGAAQPADVADSHWMAGGLEVTVNLLFHAPTAAG